MLLLIPITDRILLLNSIPLDRYTTMFLSIHLLMNISVFLFLVLQDKLLQRTHLQCKRPEFNPWVRKMPWKRSGNPLQQSCLENPTDREAWWATARRGHTESGMTEAT